MFTAEKVIFSIQEGQLFVSLHLSLHCTIIFLLGNSSSFPLLLNLNDL